MDQKLSLTAVILILFVVPSLANDVKTSAMPEKDFKARDSKFLSEAERQTWLEEMRNSLPIVKRSKGPFGLLQNLSAPVVKKRAAPVRSDAFAKAIQAIKVTAVLPADDKFFIGSREYVEGQVLPVIHGRRQFNVQIISVALNNILFKNLDTGERVTRKMDVLPQGMSRDGSIEAVKGITRPRDGKATPLNLDESFSSDEK